MFTLWKKCKKCGSKKDIYPKSNICYDCECIQTAQNRASDLNNRKRLTIEKRLEILESDIYNIAMRLNKNV